MEEAEGLMHYLRKFWEKLIHLFTRRIVTLLIVIFCASVLGALWSMSNLSTQLIESQALKNAMLSAQALKEARTLYTDDAVDRINNMPGLTVTHDYRTKEHAIPLPATFLIELSRHVRDKNSGMFVRLYSDLPFPWRKEEGGAKTNFEKEALRQLRKNPNKPFVKVDTVNGNSALLYAESDILLPSCVDCHNTYPGSPKKDWKVGDVRGVLEIIQPLEKYTAQTRQGLKGTFFMLASISAIGVIGLTIANRSLQQRSQELASAKNQLEAVLDAVPGSISWIRGDGIYLGVNRYLAQDWNLSQEAFIGKEVGFLQGSAELANFMRRFLGSEDISASQVIDVEVNDSPRYYLVAAQKYQNGEASVSVGIDVTERKKAEESLRLAEERYRGIFENALEGIFQASLEGRFIRINPAMAQTFGYNSPEEMVDSIRDIGSEVCVDSGTPQEFKRRLEEYGEVKGLEYQAYRKDKSIIWVQEDTRAVHDNSGNLLYFEGILQDITQRKRKEEELNRQLQELRIEIDHQKRKQDVAEITQSDYFQEIQGEVKDINLDEFWS